MSLAFAFYITLIHFAIAGLYALIFQRWWTARVMRRLTGRIVQLPIGPLSDLMWSVFSGITKLERRESLASGLILSQHELETAVMFLCQRDPEKGLTLFSSIHLPDGTRMATVNTIEEAKQEARHLSKTDYAVV